jgi:hypothetical protein
VQAICGRYGDGVKIGPSPPARGRAARETPAGSAPASRSDDLERSPCRARREIMTGHTTGKIALIP